MLDPKLALAFSLHANKGVFALLLGSGISRSAGIPTGWEVVLDLIRKLAALQDADCEPAPDRWYADFFGKEPLYSELLEMVARLPEERRNLLSGYFEPTPEEREEGKKQPTSAHHAIANLVARGYIKVIVTTNFDRLMEQALEAAGVQPTVIKSPDDIKGAVPLVHSPCTLVKVHGDYRDTRQRNSPDELASYDREMNHLLDQIFDQYGLVVCGWSAEWDTALVDAFRRCPSRRFSTYWTARGDVTGAAKDLCQFRNAEVIQISGADQFFSEVKEQVQALEDVSHAHPLSIKTAVARLKRYIQEGKVISAHDLVMAETERVVEQLLANEFSYAPGDTAAELNRRLSRYEAITELLQSLLVTGCYWGGEEIRFLWSRCIGRIANARDRDAGSKIWIELRLYPAVVLLYASGIAALAANRHQNLASLFHQVIVYEYSARYPAAYALQHMAVIEHDHQKLIEGKKDNLTPLPAHLYEVLKPALQPILPDDMELKHAFHQFEIIAGLAYAIAGDALGRLGDRFWAPVGCYGWEKRGYYPHPQTADGLLWEKADELGKDWGPFNAGVFGSDWDRFVQLRAEFTAFLGRVRSQWGWY